MHTWHKTTWYRLLSALALAVGALFVLGSFGVGKYPQIQPDKVLSRSLQSHGLYSIVSISGGDTGYTVGLTIQEDGKAVATISTKDIPVFDEEKDNPDAEKPVPANDYAFNDTPQIDQKRGIVYFVVYDYTYAGNKNASRALFAYDIKDTKITLIVNATMEAHGVRDALNNITLSPQGTHIVYDDGYHGGHCSNVYNLKVYDLVNGTSSASLSFSKDSYTEARSMRFDGWIDDTHFAYTEYSYPSQEACFNDGGSNPPSIKKVYDIQKKTSSLLSTIEKDPVAPLNTIEKDIIGAWSTLPPGKHPNPCKKNPTADGCSPYQNGELDSQEMDFSIEGGKRVFNSFLHSRPEDSDCTFLIDEKQVTIYCSYGREADVADSFKVISVSTSTLKINRGDDGSPSYETYYKIKNQ